MGGGNSRSEHRGMLVHTQRPHHAPRTLTLLLCFLSLLMLLLGWWAKRINSTNTPLHPNIPKPNLSIPSSTNQLPLSTALQMHTNNPLSLFSPNPYHSQRRPHT